MAGTRYMIVLAMTGSRFHRDVSTIEARDLLQAEGKALRALRALRITHDGGLRWDRWVVMGHHPRTGLPYTVALGGPDGVTWTQRTARVGR